MFAEDKRSGLILRCDVIVDVISSLNLVTTTRELYMEEAPEAFEVRAYDDQGTVETIDTSFTDPLKHNIYLNNIQQFSSYFTEYALCIYYKDQLVNLFREIITVFF